MQIVIDIDEKLYNYIQTEEYDEHLDKRFDYQIRFAVKDGTPLPKGHGRLIDADGACEGNCAECPVNDICLVNKAPTVIEADKEDE